MLDGADVLIRLTAAVVTGAILGWERESQNKPAGLKTLILVTMGSAAFMIAGVQLNEQVQANHSPIGADVMKVLAGIIGGVGFLGAGTIFRAGNAVHGLTTAATIWVASAVGIACGLGYYLLAITCLVMTIVVLVAIGVVERVFFRVPATPVDENAAAGAAPAKSNDDEK